jgi:hypothetical protein
MRKGELRATHGNSPVNPFAVVAIIRYSLNDPSLPVPVKRPWGLRRQAPHKTPLCHRYSARRIENRAKSFSDVATIR